MRCQKCGHDNSDENRFCGACGSPLAESGNNTRRFADIIPLRMGNRPVSRAARLGVHTLAPT